MDYIADFITRIRNNYQAGKETIDAPRAKVGVEIAKVLVKNGFLAKSELTKESLRLVLAYENREPLLTHIKMISKPGARIYIQAGKIRSVNGGLGILVISTPKGMMSSREARKANLGGEVICEVW